MFDHLLTQLSKVRSFQTEETTPYVDADFGVDIPQYARCTGDEEICQSIADQFKWMNGSKTLSGHLVDVHAERPGRGHIPEMVVIRDLKSNQVAVFSTVADVERGMHRVRASVRRWQAYGGVRSTAWQVVSIDRRKPLPENIFPAELRPLPDNTVDAHNSFHLLLRQGDGPWRIAVGLKEAYAMTGMQKQMIYNLALLKGNKMEGTDWVVKVATIGTLQRHCPMYVPDNWRKFIYATDDADGAFSATSPKAFGGGSMKKTSESTVEMWMKIIGATTH